MKIRIYFNTIVFSVFFLQLIWVAAAGAVNKIMPLGDSITWDDRLNDTRDDGDKIAYRYRLWQLLTDAGYEFDFVGSQFTGFDIFPDADNEGHPGWTAVEIVNGRMGSGEGKLDEWLIAEEPNIVLLHIGTNDISDNTEDENDVEAILDVIDSYESTSGNVVWVVLALIIDRECKTPAPSCQNSSDTTAFNIAVEQNVFDPRQASGDKILLVDMQNDAGIIYDLQSNGGDMWDNLHPYDIGATGYFKMGELWFNEGLVNILPQASAGPDQTRNEFEIVTLDGSGSTDPKGGTFTYLWVQTDGTPIVDLLPDDQAEQPTFEAPNVGANGETLTFQLTVTDEDGLVSTDTVDIIVQKIPPQADAGPNQAVNELDTVNLDASGSAGVGLAYEWTQTAGTDVVLSDNTAVQPFFIAPENAGSSSETLIFELKVIDEDALESTDMVSIEVNTPLNADAGPDQDVTVSDMVTLDGSASTGTNPTYAWLQTDGTPQQLSGGDTATATFTYDPAAGAAIVETLRFQLTVTDASGSKTDFVDVRADDGIPAPSGGGGGGGGGGCFIATVADGSQLAFHGKVLREPRGRFAIVDLKRLMPPDISRLAQRTEQAAMPVPALVVTVLVLIVSCIAISLIIPRKKSLNL